MAATFLIRRAVLALLAGACGPAEAPGEQAPLPAQEAPAPAAAGLYSRLLAARGMPGAPPRGPDRSYLFLGHAVFRQQSEGGTMRELPQEVQIHLGGAARLRQALAVAGRRNLFILADPAHAWVRAAGGQTWSPSAPEELAADTWLRWTACRFPWGWQDQLEDRSAGPGGAMTLDSPWGSLRIRLGTDLRPEAFETERVRLELGDWRPSPATGIWMPHRWNWIRPEDEEWNGPVERFDHVLDRSIVLDSLFRPVEVAPAGSWTATRPTADADPRRAEDEIGVVRRPGLQVLAGPPDSGAWARLRSPGSPPSSGQWERLAADGERSRALARDPLPEAPPGLIRESIPPGRWLRWASWQAPGLEDAAQQLRRWAADSGEEAQGAVWSRVIAAGDSFRLTEFMVRLRAR